ncbi:MAG: plasmid pRiA4b ORF-3 family protein [Bacteroides sp.]|nr:plasmid pRiA4b ORF-3 family protein [Bacteroides sp.]
MIYRFTIISDEVDNFVREIQIDPEATFFDFHKAILKSVNFTDDQMTSFFICDDDWEKEKEVTLEEMDTNSEMDNWTMEDTLLNELIEDEKQRLIYVFDNLTERSFFIELSEIITGKEIKTPKCTRQEGEPPVQVMDFDDAVATPGSSDLGENFYGDEDFDIDDFDMDGFDIGGNPTTDNAEETF